MAAIFITDSDNNTLEIDATITDSRTYASKITSKPIEDGSNLVDSKIFENPQFSIEGFISNTPRVAAKHDDVTLSPDFSSIPNLAQFFNFDTTEVQHIKFKNVEVSSPVLNAYSFLQNLYKSFQPFSIQVSGFDEIENLVVKNLKIDFTPETGNCLHFNLEMEQIRIVGSQTTTLPKTKEQSKLAPKKQNGAQQPKEVENKSSIFKLGEKIFDFGKKF